MSTELSPKQIVQALDCHIVGQQAAKRAVAIALRNRWRRQQVHSPLREEITPKNILMIGPTGVGKTEIARRLARLAQAPFIKVEATKYTEVGYVGRDVESIIRDLLDTAINMVREEHRERVKEKASQAAEERLLDILIPHAVNPGNNIAPADATDRHQQTREKMRHKLRLGELDQRQVEIEVQESPKLPNMQMFSVPGSNGMDEIDLKGIFGNLLGGGRRKPRRMRVRDARRILEQQEADRLIDDERIQQEARERAENHGIVFIDEIDKVTHRTGRDGDVSREGVQRDLLPLVEGTCVHTRHGPVHTDHILFIASGAFHLAKPSDLIPELQGRFPIRVHLDALREQDFRRILTEPESSLTQQYSALLQTEDVHLEFTEDGLEEIARLAVRINEKTENIGARRLHTLMERVLEEISFNAPDCAGVHLRIDAAYVRRQLGEVAESEDLSRYIL